jgi:hypothetical protein
MKRIFVGRGVAVVGDETCAKMRSNYNHYVIILKLIAANGEGNLW